MPHTLRMKGLIEDYKFGFIGLSTRLAFSDLEAIIKPFLIIEKCSYRRHLTVKQSYEQPPYKDIYFQVRFHVWKNSELLTVHRIGLGL